MHRGEQRRENLLYSGDGWRGRCIQHQTFFIISDLHTHTQPTNSFQSCHNHQASLKKDKTTKLFSWLQRSPSCFYNFRNPQSSSSFNNSNNHKAVIHNFRNHLSVFITPTTTKLLVILPQPPSSFHNSHNHKAVKLPQLPNSFHISHNLQAVNNNFRNQPAVFIASTTTKLLATTSATI
jgi:hypothetical protein